MEIIFWTLASYTVLSFIEYYIHKFHMHRPGFLNKLHPWLFDHHQKIHHPAYRENFDISNPIEHKDIGIGTPIHKVSIPALIAAILLGYFVSITGGIIFFSCVIIHMIAWNVFHSAMHDPKETWLKKKGIYKFLARHHYMHHLYPRKNFNVICLLADYILGSKKYPDAEDQNKLDKYGL